MKKPLKKSLIYRLIRFFSIISVSAVLLVAFATFSTTSVSHRKSLMRIMTDTLTQVCNQSSERLSTANVLCENLSRNVGFHNLLSTHFLNEEEMFSADLSGSSILMSMENYLSYVHGVYVFGENGGQYKSNILSFKTKSFKNTDWYKQVIAASAPVWFYSDRESVVVKSTKQSFVYIGYPFVSKYTGKAIGVILVEITVSDLFPNLFGEMENHTNIILYDIKDGSAIPVISGGSIPLSQELVLRIAGGISSETPVVSASDKDFLVLAMNVKPSPWTAVASIRHSGIKLYSAGTLLIIAAILLLIMSVSVMCAILFSQSIVRPIDSLVSSMKNVEHGDFTISVPVENADELGQLTNSFNHLVSKIRSLIENIYQNQEQLRTAELKTMQAQINPHFLYNSLDSIAWLQTMGQTDKAIRMTQSLSTLFRILLSKGKTFITIAQEIEHIESYLTIQHLRYSKKFDYEISVDEKLLQFFTIKVILQPLVENSIYHGLKESGKLFIQIRAERRGSDIALIVSDDGIGIAPDTLQKLHSQFASPHEPVVCGYGLSNVNARVKMYFGEMYGLQLESIPGVGTTATILIPEFVTGDE